ncbi:TetR/AcrR family transcriptional regulator [Streptomyces sp. V1I1]|uniref:TetR/AcrR family transcriptional regulator n=1 Tax=Streptomyces sp. V1I1 TaxID=3042272 RepID=UPI0027809B03|nr:TetR/AcrR family transcriptional regulator [Streptomyces sp. V1I1]MDQ0943409.1 AcrR family transcriptional regulator [Streptomyces sp. V1I1]
MPQPTTPEPAATTAIAAAAAAKGTSGPASTTGASRASGTSSTSGAAKAPGTSSASGAAKAAGTAPRTAKPRRRQARGERRIAQLLEAAANVFCSSGYTAASTNAIAREAGVSPGTLYQFFPNKEAIAVELGGRLLEQWRESHGAALTAANLNLPLDELLDAVLDPLFAFNHENPAFAVLMHGPDIPGQITQEFNALHAGLLTRIEEIIAGYLPDAPPAELSRTAATIFAIFKAGLDLVLTHEGEERQAYIAEVKKVMFGYLNPIVGEAVTATTERRNAAPGSH